MESKPVGKFLWTGTAVRFLQDASARHRIYSAGGVLVNLRGLLQDINDLNLQVTRASRAYAALQAMAVEWEAARPEIEEEAEVTLSDEERKALRLAADDLRLTLDAETRITYAFVTRPKRHEIQRLSENIGSLMTPGVFDALSDIAQTDLEEAGKCIVFERSTAAAFHLMRATEDTLKCFYLATVKRDRVKPLMWGPMTNHLRRRRTPPPLALLDVLDHIRRNFRNPTQHPEMTYNIEEVQDLFALAVDAINRLVDNMPKT